MVAGIGDIARKRVIPAILAQPRSTLAAVVIARDPRKAEACVSGGRGIRGDRRGCGGGGLRCGVHRGAGRHHTRAADDCLSARREARSVREAGGAQSRAGAEHGGGDEEIRQIAGRGVLPAAVSEADSDEGTDRERGDRAGRACGRKQPQLAAAGMERRSGCGIRRSRAEGRCSISGATGSTRCIFFSGNRCARRECCRTRCIGWRWRIRPRC